MTTITTQFKGKTEKHVVFGKLDKVQFIKNKFARKTTELSQVKIIKIEKN